ncbi:MAG TPA: BlaI/MecI/CopY family transcriptional regulator [Polyangiales bacterium]|nr:BlaI/MecI/CopY family transcriptional regulator [Polyangiales bacterium]
MTQSALTDLQLSLMKALWSIGEGSVAEVLEALEKDGKMLAPTTVATLLQRLSKQGWVRSRKAGRQLIYRAQVDRQQAASGALRRVLRSFFEGSISAATAQLLESDQLSSEELKEMRSLISKKEG